jgi:hypothetical protein
MKHGSIFALLVALVSTSQAQELAGSLKPSTAFVAEGGVTVDGGYSLTGGVAWPWAWRHVSHSGEWTAMTEAYVSIWSSRVAGDRKNFTQVGLIPVFRYRFDQGRSAWFANAGIGLSYMDRLYQRDTKQFSTRFNFIDVIGVGFNFGERRENELELRIAHISNGGIKSPNPGENFLQLRYARNF